MTEGTVTVTGFSPAFPRAILKSGKALIKNSRSLFGAVSGHYGERKINQQKQRMTGKSYRKGRAIQIVGRVKRDTHYLLPRSIAHQPYLLWWKQLMSYMRWIVKQIAGRYGRVWQDRSAYLPKVSLCPPPDTLKKSMLTDFDASTDSSFIWDGGTSSSESPEVHETYSNTTWLVKMQIQTYSDHVWLSQLRKQFEI